MKHQAHNAIFMVPSTVLLLGTNPVLQLLVSFERVECDPSHQSEVLGAMFVVDLAQILAHCDIQRPMKTVLNAPVIPDERQSRQSAQSLRTADEIMRALLRRVAFRASPFNPDQTLDLRPLRGDRTRRDVVAHPHFADLVPTMPVLFDPRVRGEGRRVLRLAHGVQVAPNLGMKGRWACLTG